MSAADDRMVVRTRDGGYASLPRRVANGLLSTGRAKPAPAEALPKVKATGARRAPDDVEQQIATAMGLPPAALVSEDPGINHWSAPEAEMAATIEAKADAARKLLDALGLGSDAPVSEANDPDDDEIRCVVMTPATIDPPLSEPRGNASRVTWAEYAESVGVAVTDDMSRNEIRAAAKAAALSTARMPQPARDAGGRLETPEDEPATEQVADDQDPGSQ